MAADIDIRNLAIFCASLRGVGSRASVVIFVNDAIAHEQALLSEKYDVHFVVYERARLEPAFLRRYHPSSLRWVLFDWFLGIDNGKYQHRFDRVLALDVRDSAFQSDPFLLLGQGPSLVPRRHTNSSSDEEEQETQELLVFGENRLIPISSCSWNNNWIRDCFGQRILERVRDQPISCSGVVLGSVVRMADYIHQMGQTLLNNNACLSPDSQFPTCERNGVDQGVHNVLLHLQFLEPVRVKYADDFPVVNLQSSPDLMLSRDLGSGRDGLFMDKYPLVPYAIVHQYDRDSVLQRQLGKKYLSGIDWDSPIADWAQSEVCTSNFGVVFGADLLRGKCDAGSVRAMTPAVCCTACLKQRQSLQEKGLASEQACTSFAFVDGVCFLKTCPQKDVKLLVKLVTDPDFKDMSVEGQKAVSGYLKIAI
jgi:hypothetical protein